MSLESFLNNQPLQSVFCTLLIHTHWDTDFNKWFKQPEMYWFESQNYANDRQTVKLDKLDRAWCFLFVFKAEHYVQCKCIYLFFCDFFCVIQY